MWLARWENYSRLGVVNGSDSFTVSNSLLVKHSKTDRSLGGVVPYMSVSSNVVDKWKSWMGQLKVNLRQVWSCKKLDHTATKRGWLKRGSLKQSSTILYYACRKTPELTLQCIPTGKVGPLLTCAPRRSIVLQFFWHVDTRPISPFLFFFNSTFYLCIIIVIFYLMYFIH